MIRYSKKALFAFLFLSLTHAYSCMLLDNIAPKLSLSAEQSLNIVHYSSALLVAAYPIYWGAQRFKNLIEKDDSTHMYTLDQLHDFTLLGTQNSSSIDISYLYLLIKEDMDNLKITPKQQAKIQFCFTGESAFFYERNNPASASHKCLYLHPSFFSQTREEQAHTVNHELLHIKERHSLIKATAALSFPFLSYYATRSYFIFLQKLRGDESLPPNGHAVLATIFPILSLGITITSLGFLSTYLEKRADLQGSNTLKVLVGAVLAYNPHDRTKIQETQNYSNKTNEKNHFFKLPSKDTILKFLEILYHIHDHPSNIQRFTYFSDKLIAFEKKERIKHNAE